MIFTEDDVDRAAAKVSDTLNPIYSFATGVPWERASSSRRDYFRKIVRIAFGTVAGPEPKPFEVGDLVVDLPRWNIDLNTGCNWYLCRVDRIDDDGSIILRDDNDDLVSRDPADVTRFIVDLRQPE